MAAAGFVPRLQTEDVLVCSGPAPGRAGWPLQSHGGCREGTEVRKAEKRWGSGLAGSKEVGERLERVHVRADAEAEGHGDDAVDAREDVEALRSGLVGSFGEVFDGIDKEGVGSDVKAGSKVAGTGEAGVGRLGLREADAVVDVDVEGPVVLGVGFADVDVDEREGLRRTEGRDVGDLAAEGRSGGRAKVDGDGVGGWVGVEEGADVGEERDGRAVEREDGGVGCREAGSKVVGGGKG